MNSREVIAKIKNKTNSEKDEDCKLRVELKMHYGLVSLFNGISTFMGYLMPKPSF